MCDHGSPMTIVPTPEWAASSRHHPENGIPIDPCIADAIQDAWHAGVRTLGSCCGHGKGPASVVLTTDRDQPGLARKHLPGWQLFQWQLVDVTNMDHPADAR